MKKILLLVLCTIGFSANAQLVHPGISHKLSDLERIKNMVETGQEPWTSEFANFRSNNKSLCNYSVRGDLSITEITNHNNFQNDGYAAYYNAIMWYVTGLECHAEKAIEIFNSWTNVTNTTGIPLDQGRGPWKMCEGAEIIKHTYDGWLAEDQQKFADMLVYPGYSTTTVPTGDKTFYWNIYQGDPARYGNQGLFAYRSLMAMGIFLDNEIMYDRVLRYLRGEAHRPDDLAYPSGPPNENNNTLSQDCEFIEERGGAGFDDFIEDYGYNEVMSNYIYENGQCQESARDQVHSAVGIQIIACMAEIAWNQGDDLYSHLDNRLLLGIEFFMRYNVGADQFSSYGYPDWNPTVASGEFVERRDRSGRFLAKKINPHVVCDFTRHSRGNDVLDPWYEMVLGHYKDRMDLPESNFPWLLAGQNIYKNEIGFENESNTSEYHGWGGFKFHRVSAGDPISGFASNGLPMYEMNTLPTIIEAENYDYFVLNGQGRTYNDLSETNEGGVYRTDENVDIKASSEGGYHINKMQSGEYLTYTANVPETGIYNIGINYAGITGNGILSISFDNSDLTGAVPLPATGGEQVWTDFTLANDVNLTQGVKSMKITVGGIGNSFNLNSINITAAQKFDQSISFEPLPRTRIVDNDINLNSTSSASSGLELSFSSSDTSIASVVNNNYLQINGVGTTIITASQAGNDLYNPAQDVTIEFEVNPEGLGLFIEAEYFNSQLGLQTEVTIDEGGGLNIGFADDGDYLEYLVDVPVSGIYLVDYRLASRSAGGTLSLLVNGVVVDNLSFLATGNWQNWETISSFNEVFLEGGLNTIRINVDAGGWNINWFEFREASTLSINDISIADNFQIYPNPTTNTLYINNGLGYTVSIYNILGEEVLTAKLEEYMQSLDVTSLNAGVYFVKIGDDNKAITKKLIIK